MKKEQEEKEYGIAYPIILIISIITVLCKVFNMTHAESNTSMANEITKIEYTLEKFENISVSSYENMEYRVMGGFFINTKDSHTLEWSSIYYCMEDSLDFYKNKLNEESSEIKIKLDKLIKELNKGETR